MNVIKGLETKNAKRSRTAAIVVDPEPENVHVMFNMRRALRAGLFDIVDTYPRPATSGGMAIPSRADPAA
jgi:hypothetical protein